MTASSKDRVPGRDKGKIIKLKMHYTTKLRESSIRQKILPATWEIEQSLVQVVIRDRLRLKRLCNVMEATFYRQNRRTGLQS